MLDTLLTPKKLNQLVLAPSFQKGDFDCMGIDCPFPFRHDNRFYMTYIGFDGLGYRTGLATSDDLVHWTKQGLLIDRGPVGSITEHQIALTSILRDNDLFGPGTLKKVNGQFLATYHAYPGTGYESGPAVIGIATSGDLKQWTLSDPVLRANDGAEWERGGLYKSWLMEHDGLYYLFYNAKNHLDWPWVEQTGFATSTDLVHWTRHPANPILPVGPEGAFDDVFASDPCVFRHRDQWVLFYFGLCSDNHARESVATSHDLRTWIKSDRILIDVGPAGTIDCIHAHKPGMIVHEGKLYHFYCAVGAASPQAAMIGCRETRGISLATS